MLLYIDYKLYYQPVGTCRKYFFFNAKNDEEAKQKAVKYCKEVNAELYALHKITAEHLMGEVNADED